MRDITGLPVYLDLGVLRYVSRYAFGVPEHSVNFRNIVYRAVFILPCLIIIEAGCLTVNEKLVTMINGGPDRDPGGRHFYSHFI